jgi:phage tail protein X
LTVSQNAPLHDASELDASLLAVEQAITELGQTLSRPDPAAVEQASGALQVTLRAAMGIFAKAANRGPLPDTLRTRFANANARVAAIREAVFRANSGVDQHLEILFPREMAQASTYSAQGANGRGPGRVIAAS